MLRRDCILEDGRPGWLLISQVEHARLAAELARAWMTEKSRPTVGDASASAFAGVNREDFFAAVAHHDDGWIEWERAPSVVPDDGRPRSFMEMPLDETLGIWSRSIALAESLGPFAAWLVAGHFAMMLAGGSDRGDPRSAKWLNQVGLESARWFSEWRASQGTEVEIDSAEEALEQLRFFDALSLWLCCSVPTRGEAGRAECPAPPDSPDGTALSATARDDGVRVAPWPFREDEIVLTADAFQLPRRRYTGAEDILAARTHSALTWRLEESA